VKVDGPNVIDLALGADRRIPEEGDAQITIPSLIMPVLLQLKPTRFVQLAVTLQRDSALASLFDSRTNQAQISRDVINIDKGLWEFEISMATSCNFAYVANSDFGVSCDLAYAGFTIPLLKRFFSIGNFNDYNRLRLLLVEPAKIQSNISLTGVGQSADMRLTVNAIRIL